MVIISRRQNIVHSSWVLSLSTCNKKQTYNLCIGNERKQIFSGQRLSWLQCTVVWFQLVHFYSRRGSVIGISSLPIFSCFQIMSSSLLILGRVRIIFMIPMTKIGRLLRWLRYGVLRSTCRRYCGRHMLLMEVQGLPSIIFINPMFLVLGSFWYSWRWWMRLLGSILRPLRLTARNL